MAFAEIPGVGWVGGLVSGSPLCRMCACACVRMGVRASCVCEELPLGGQSCSVVLQVLGCAGSQELRARPACATSPAQVPAGRFIGCCLTTGVIPLMRTLRN